MTIERYPFISACEAAVHSIDERALAQSALRACIGDGSTYSMFTTGVQTQTRHYVGCKLQRRGQSAPIKRFVEEVSTMAVLAANNAALLRTMPQLMGLLKVRETGYYALLTEDASKNQQVAVEPTEMSHDLAYMLRQEIGDHGSLITGVHGDFKDYMAFRVAGVERILDAEPSPFVRAPEERSEIQQELMAMLSNFTVEIPSSSQLAISLQAPPWNHNS